MKEIYPEDAEEHGVGYELEFLPLVGLENTRMGPSPATGIKSGTFEKPKNEKH